MSQHDGDTDQKHREQRKAAARDALLKNPTQASRGGYIVEEWVRIGIFRDPSFVWMLCRRLQQTGIIYQLEFTRFDATISVHRDRRGEAFAILDHQKQLDPPSTPNLRKHYDALIVFGFVLVMIVVLIGFYSTYNAILAAIVLGVGVARADSHSIAARWRGTIELGLVDLFAGFVVLGALFAAFR